MKTTFLRGWTCICFMAALLLLPTLPACAEGSSEESGTGTFRNLTPDEIRQLADGETLIRAVKDPSKLALAVSSTQATIMRSRIASVRPNYIAEMIALSPLKEGDAALERLAAALEDVKGYIGIPYWSRHNKITVDLFDKMEIISKTTTDTLTIIDVVQHMEPFNDFKARYSLHLTGSPGSPDYALWYTSENTSPIVYQGINSVSPGNLIWFLYAFSTDSTLVFYGVGVVKTWDMFGLIRDRLETSFMGREESFMGFMSKKLR